MPNAIDIRPIQNSDLTALVQLQSGVHPEWRTDSAFAEAFYNWKYFDLTGRDTGYPAALVANDEQGMVGFLGCMPFMLQYHDQQVETGWIADWMLAERGHGQGIGKKLLQTAVDTIPAMACVDGSEAGQHMFRKLGFQEWDCARGWLQINHPFAYEWPTRTGWRKPLGFYRALQHRGSSRPNLSPSNTSTEIRLGDVISLEKDTFVFEPYQRDGLVRTLDYMRWLTRCPAASTYFQLILISGDIAGYLFSQIDQDTWGRQRGRILELRLKPEVSNLLTDAWQSASRSLIQTHQLDYLDTVTSLSETEALQQAGFTPRRIKKFWLKTKAFTYGSQDQWYLTLVDKDDAFRGAGLVP
ncbi:MAG: GNAT family N-acetyltransferase [Chloroflexota bacterium]